MSASLINALFGGKGMDDLLKNVSPEIDKRLDKLINAIDRNSSAMIELTDALNDKNENANEKS